MNGLYHIRFYGNGFLYVMYCHNVFLDSVIFLLPTSRYILSYRIKTLIIFRWQPQVHNTCRFAYKLSHFYFLIFTATTVVVSLYILIQMWKTKEWVIKPHSIWAVPERHTHLVQCWANRHSTNITHFLPPCTEAYSTRQRVDYIILLLR